MQDYGPFETISDSLHLPAINAELDICWLKDQNPKRVKLHKPIINSNRLSVPIKHHILTLFTPLPV